MEEQIIVAEQPKIEERPVVEVKSTPFAKDGWSETPPEPKKEEAKPEIKTEAKPTETSVEEEEILDPKDWLKREFDIDDATILKAEREEYKKLKAQKPEEQKWENEDSKKIYEYARLGKTKELRDFLDRQDRIQTYTTADVTKDTAPEIIKLGMQLANLDANGNPRLTKDEIEFQYKQDFGIPKEPVQKVTESEEDFTERMDEWKERVQNIEMKKVVAAKMAIPQLEQLKTKIVLPELEKPKATIQEPSQESLDALKKIRESFLSQLESNFSKVEGFTTKVKDESVEIPVMFKIPDEDKIAIKGRLAQDFDVENYIGERWFDDKGNPKVETIISDIYELENRDKIHSGIANNAAAKRLDEYIKSQKNINLKNQTPQQTFQPQQNGDQKASPFAKDAWSEKPPILQN